MTTYLSEQNYRFGIHKETNKMLEVFMLFPKRMEFIDELKGNISAMPLPARKQLGKYLSKYPNVSRMMSRCRSGDVKTYASPGFVVYRNSIYAHHLYDFVRNDHVKIEITAMYDPKRRNRTAVMKDCINILEKVAAKIPHDSCLKHSLE